MVSAAGPISNFCLAIVAFIVLKVMLISGLVHQPTAFRQGGPFDVVIPTAQSGGFMEPLVTLLSILLTLNVTLGVFNLIPIPPLDGSHVLEEVLPDRMAQAYEQIRPYGFILLLALLWTPVLGWIIRPVYSLVGLMLFGAS